MAKPLRLPGPAALKTGLRSWLKQEQSSLPSPAALRAALLASLLVLSPLLAVELRRRLGMRLWVAAFGTGYSSLQLLQTLRPDEVKIDQSFVLGMSQDLYARRLVGLLAGMAPVMGVEIVAEGVENRAAFEILRDLGVHRFQGYLFSPPPSPERITALHCPAGRASALR